MDTPAESLHISLFERQDISLGEEVSLELGHDGENERVFTGKVALVRPALGGVEVFALGRMEALLALRTSATFEGQAVGSIARDLIGQAGLETGSVDDGPTLPRFAVDKRLSAYAHLKGLADRLGYELYTNRDGQIMFHALGDAAGLDAGAGGLLGAAAGAVASAASTLIGLGGAEGYQYGLHLIQAHATRRPPEWGKVEVGGESAMSSQGESTAHWLTVNDSDFRGSAGDGSPALLVLDSAARSKDLADRFSAGRLAVANRSAHQVSITVLGRPQVDLGSTLNVSEVPDGLLNGEGYVRSICHRFGENTGFTSQFRIALSLEDG
jgi:phage protein D